MTIPRLVAAVWQRKVQTHSDQIQQMIALSLSCLGMNYRNIFVQH